MDSARVHTYRLPFGRRTGAHSAQQDPAHGGLLEGPVGGTDPRREGLGHSGRVSSAKDAAHVDGADGGNTL